MGTDPPAQLEITRQTFKGGIAWQLRQTGGRPNIPFPVLYQIAADAESYARWTLDGPGGTIRIVDDAGTREVVIPGSHTWLSTR